MKKSLQDKRWEKLHVESCISRKISKALENAYRYDFQPYFVVN